MVLISHNINLNKKGSSMGRLCVDNVISKS